MITYKNEYGVLELVPLEYRDINTVLVTDTPDEYRLDLETAEKIALITENCGVQLAFGDSSLGLKQAIVVHHSGPRTVAVCRVHSLDFKPGVNAREEIERHAKQVPLMI
jgi:hypothetical protein